MNRQEKVLAVIMAAWIFKLTSRNIWILTKQMRKKQFHYDHGDIIKYDLYFATLYVTQI